MKESTTSGCLSTRNSTLFIFHRDPTVYGDAFIFYNKKYDTVKILHYDMNGYVIYQKWFDDGKMLKPKFMEIKDAEHE